MNCRKISGMLSEFLDGSLTQKDQDAVRKHLSSCRKCRENWKYLQQYQQDIASLPPTKAPDNMINKVLDRISKEDSYSHPHMRSFPLWPKVLITAAMLAGLAYILIPGKYYLPLKPETEMQITSPKKDKGTRHTESVPGKSDLRLEILEALTHKHGGRIIETEQTHPEGLLNAVILKIPTSQYYAFAGDYNQMHFGGQLPAEKRFSIWPRYIIKIYLPSHSYLIEDFNDDHQDDIL
ncbi:MAG: zf-HC2 domain-containing protein, partial [Bacteroidetes bacterium]|nr:zf-HC2 domain-containing protein [Bacteroidota bacterium]